jgi:hypothetical protein
MKTETEILKGDIYARFCPIYKKYDFMFWPRHGDKNIQNIESWAKQGYIYLSPFDIEIEVPKDVDLRKSTLKLLQEKRKLVLSDNQMKLNQIDNEIQEFLAIENKP